MLSSLVTRDVADRLVESSSVKRAIESVYSGVLPKGAFPFVYLRCEQPPATRLCIKDISLDIDPRSVDVNVHPTKREVIFLNEEMITERISDAIQQVISQSHSRTFEYQVGLNVPLYPCLRVSLDITYWRSERIEYKRQPESRRRGRRC